VSKSPKNVRRAAVSALRAWSKGHVYADTLVERHSHRNHLSQADRGLLNSIILSVLRHRRLLDHWIGLLRKGKLDHETRDVLRVGLSQLLILGIADHAAVNETVACARTPVRGLINAVLRRAISGRKRLLRDMDELDPAIKHSHPDWMWNRWKREFGAEPATALMAWNNDPAPTFLRLNPLKPADPGFEAEPVAGHPGFLQIDGPVPNAFLDAGHGYITDPSTAGAVKLLAPKPGETILDACAAPGGKAALIASEMQNDGHLLCTDLNEKRLPRLGENLSKLGVTNSATAAFDWTSKPPAEWHDKFDAILLDVPCSNTGVLRRRVDARWRLTSAQITELAGIQSRILRNALPCLRRGGRLVYSTCSIEEEENGHLAKAFLGDHPGFALRESTRTLPFVDRVDGAFAALLMR